MFVGASFGEILYPHEMHADLRTSSETAFGPPQIALACDQNYAPGLLMAIASIASNSSFINGAVFHILDGGLAASTRRKVEMVLDRAGCGAQVLYHQVDIERFRGAKLMGSNALTYARLLLPEILPAHREVLYLDVDVYYAAEVGDLWRVPLEGKAVAAARDFSVPCLRDDGPWLDPDDPSGVYPYFNAGVLKINLEWWRDNDLARKAIALAVADPAKCKCWDQTVLNHLLRGQVVWIEDRFNVMLIAADPWRHLFELWEGDLRDLPESLPTTVDAKLLQGFNLHFVARNKPWRSFDRHPLWQFWRHQYSLLVPGCATYKWRYEYLGRFVWSHLIESPLIIRFLLVSRLYEVIPGLTRARLEGRARHLAVHARTRG